jgi:hypothetical protein
VINLYAQQVSSHVFGKKSCIRCALQMSLVFARRLLSANDCYWRILATNVVAALFGKPNRDWSMCEENTAYI